jgi:hypothetical protein
MRQSTDPRDWIYGLLALPNDLDILGIVPDYNLAYDIVYAKYSRAVIQNGNLEMLRYAHFYNSQENSLPSWIPDWKQHPSTKFDYEDDSNNDNHIKPPLFYASLDTKISVVDMNDEKLLALQGFIVDDIEILGERAWEGTHVRKDNDDETLFYLSTVEKMCALSAAKNNSIYTTAQRRAEAIWRIPIGDLRVRLPDSGQWCNERANSECYEAYNSVLKLEHLLQKKNFASVEELNHRTWMVRNESASTKVYRASMRGLGDKRVFMTKVGYVGLGPTFAEKGDKIVVFKGGAVPFVVRGTGDGDGRYWLLGEAYCDGVMDGEIVGVRTEETIVLI